MYALKRRPLVHILVSVDMKPSGRYGGRVTRTINRMSWSLSALLAWTTVAVPGLFDPADAVAMATVVLATVAVLLAARLVGTLPAAPAPVPATPTRARTRRAAPVRSVDPDAAGRPRPRAPGTSPAA